MGSALDMSPFWSSDGPISFIKSSCKVLDILLPPVPLIAILAEFRCGWFRILSPAADDLFLIVNGNEIEFKT